VFFKCPQSWGLNRYRKLDATFPKLLKLLDFAAALQHMGWTLEAELSRGCDTLAVTFRLPP